MIDKSNLSDDPIAGIEEVYQTYGSVLKAGVFTFNLGDTTHLKLNHGKNPKGKPYTRLSGMTLRVVGDKTGNTEGAPVGATLRFQQAWIEQIVNAVYNKAQIAAGDAPTSEKGQATFLDTVAEDKVCFKAKVDWNAFDVIAYNALLIELAETEDREDPLAMAKQMADQSQKDEASLAATLAESYTDFPQDANGNRLPFITVDEGEETERTVRAQAKVVRYFLAE